MLRTTVVAVALTLLVGASGANAQGAGANAAATVNPATVHPASLRIRYMVEDVPATVAFYTTHLGFKVDMSAGAYFAALSRGGLQLLVSPTKGPGGASQPMPDGKRPAPGGWNRIVLYTPDLQGEVERLRKAGVHFRNEITTGPGGREILLDDPSGNPVELFQPA